MSQQILRKPLPMWAAIGAILGAIGLASLWGWHFFTANSLPNGPKQAVRPGMVNFVKEAQSGKVTQERQDPDDAKENAADSDKPAPKDTPDKDDKD